eukprot:967216-Prorocentrum_lima.AAC.1
MEMELPENLSKGISNVMELYVQSNWSVHDSTLKDGGSALSLTIILLFPQLCAALVASEAKGQKAKNLDPELKVCAGDAELAVGGTPPMATLADA